MVKCTFSFPGILRQNILLQRYFTLSKIFPDSVLKYSCTAVAVSTVDTDGAAACGNDARQAFLLESLPSGLNQRHQYVSPNGHGARLGWRPVMS